MTLTNEVAEGKFFGWLAHNPHLLHYDYNIEDVMHETFVAAFESGAKWGIRTSAKLSDPSFREAITAVAEGLSRES